MLVLGRRCGERIMIGHNIAVTVLDIRGNKVRLGFSAPHDVSIHRQEVYRLIHNNERKDMEVDQPEAPCCR